MSNTTLIETIIKKELAFFLAVNNRDGPSGCQEHPDAFCAARKMSHAVQSEQYLKSYLNDLEEAKQQGRNIMTEKYAHMENLIPRTNHDNRIEIIVSLEGAWYDEVTVLYPHIVSPQSKENFRLYLTCELQTLSPQSLMYYQENIMEARNQKRNLVHERYENLMNSLNLPSLAEREAQLAMKIF